MSDPILKLATEISQRWHELLVAFAALLGALTLTLKQARGAFTAIMPPSGRRFDRRMDEMERTAKANAEEIAEIRGDIRAMQGATEEMSRSVQALIERR